ncbi:MAG TPA: 3-deoxy-manno-octulosonate cytidylyltransferase [Epsilonproteobacteria bacterium]|nr:3-deoxy-manno-octulosonate cytidylyltransferase [Campylobacterota bacterium]
MIIIPARIGSTRFPKKVLADIDGIPMVIRTAMAVQNVDQVLIATDSLEVVKIAHTYKIDAVMTNSEHQSGTDRVFDAAKQMGLKKDEIIINVQGDEPFIEEAVVQAVFDLTHQNRIHTDVIMNSCYKILTSSQAGDPNSVKVVTDKNQMALYFSRAKIPYPRDDTHQLYQGHIGIYGFTMASLEIFCSLKVAPLEEIEKLEQLRALYHGYRIGMTRVETKSFGIDTPEDLQKAIDFHRL